MCIKSKGLHRSVGSSAAFNVLLKKAVFQYMLKQPPAVGLDILAKLRPCSGIMHQIIFLRLCRMDGAAGENEEE